MIFKNPTELLQIIYNILFILSISKATQKETAWVGRKVPHIKNVPETWELQVHPQPAFCLEWTSP